MPNKFESDPWLENTDPFTRVDFSPEKPLFDSLPDIAAAHPDLVTDIQEETPAPAPQPQPQAAPAAPPEPEVTEFSDGSSMILERTGKGWKATLDTGLVNSNPEVFYGKTKEEIFQNMAYGKVNATRQIKELQKKIKLGVGDRMPVRPIQPQIPQERLQVPQAAYPQVRELTVNEKHEIQLLFASDPVAANEKWFMYRFGMTPDQAMATITSAEQKADRGVVASKELATEAVARQFISTHPEYYSVQTNYATMIAWLAKYKLGVRLAPDASNANAIIETLYDNGLWTVDTLEEAFEDLKSDGLLEFPTPEEEEDETPQVVVQRRPQPAPQPQPQPVAVTPPPAQDDRIVRSVRRPRAGLGIRNAEVSTNQPTEAKPPSVEELDDLTDDEINQLFAGVRRQRLQQTRR